jgi:hypothetical protein
MSGIIGESPNMNSGSVGKPPIGSIIQVQEGVLAGRVQHDSQSFTDIGISVAITPRFASSYILLSWFFSRCQTTQSTLDHGVAFRVHITGGNAGATANDINGTAAGNRLPALFVTGGMSYNSSHNFGGYGGSGLDKTSLTTSTVTYKIQAWNQRTENPTILNGTSNNTDVANHYQSQGKCRLVAQEIST